MPQKATVTKYTAKAKRGFSATRLQPKKDTQTVDVALGDGETMVLTCNDLSVGTVRGFMRAANNDDMDAAISSLLSLASGWATYDDEGNVVPILDDQGDPYPLNETTLNALDVGVFQKIGESLGKLAPQAA